MARRRTAAAHAEVDSSNSLEEVNQSFLEEVEDHLDRLDSLRGEYMSACKAVRQKIKDSYVSAKEAGVKVRPLKALVKWRQLERKKIKIEASFEEDEDEAAIYARLVENLGPLGMAAAREAGYSEAS